MISQNNSTKTIEEQKLVNRIVKGDKKALFSFYRQYQKRLLAFIKRKIANSADAEELLQDVFLASLDNLRDFNFKSSLYTYLCAIARFKVIDYYRRKKITQIVFSRFPAIKKIIAKVITPDEKLVRKELKLEILKVLKKLKPIYKKIIILKYREEKTIKQIARILNLNPKSVESLLFRARKKFAVIYEEKTKTTTHTNSKTKRNSQPPT